MYFWSRTRRTVYNSRSTEYIPQSPDAGNFQSEAIPAPCEYFAKWIHRCTPWVILSASVKIVHSSTFRGSGVARVLEVAGTRSLYIILEGVYGIPCVRFSHRIFDHAKNWSYSLGGRVPPISPVTTPLFLDRLWRSAKISPIFQYFQNFRGQGLNP